MNTCDIFNCMFDDDLVVTDAGPFLPTDIPGCACWLECTRPGAVTVSSGSNVLSWNDQSGNGANANNFDSVNFPQFPAGSKAINFAATIGPPPTVIPNPGLVVTTNSFGLNSSFTVIFVFTTADFTANTYGNISRLITLWSGDGSDSEDPSGFLPLQIGSYLDAPYFKSFCSDQLCEVDTFGTSKQFIGIATLDTAIGQNTLEIGGYASYVSFGTIMDQFSKILISCNSSNNENGFYGLAYEFIAWPRILNEDEYRKLLLYLVAKYPSAI